MWTLSSKFQSSQTCWKCERCASSCMAHFGHRSVLLEQDRLLGDWRLLLQIPDCMRRLPNSSTHAMIKELGLVFTKLGRPFILRSDNGPCYSSREFHNFLSFYHQHQQHHHQQPTLSTKTMDLLKLWWESPRN